MLPFIEFASLCSITPLIPHLGRLAVALDSYDFTWLKEEDPDWKCQTTVPQSHAKATLAAMLHYGMHAPDVMRYLGGTYTGEHRNVDETVATLTEHGVDPWLIAQYVRAISVGSPNHFVATTSRANAELHRVNGNHSSVRTFLVETVNTAVKEHRNRFNMPLGCYMSRYVPHCFITPQHALSKPGKTLRLIFDAAKRYTADSTPLNMMTSTPFGTEMRCLYGDAFVTFLERIWDLRITYPLSDIAMHANDIKSCFRQMKLHPDIVPAFSIVIANYLFLQTALPFGMDFSPQNWEPVRRLVEVLSEKLHSDRGLRTKHRKYLDLLNWDKALGHLKLPPVVAKACAFRKGVLDPAGKPKPTPQRSFVDDLIYADVYETTRSRMEQAVAAGIEAIFILLGRSDLAKRQDPVAWDKMVDQMVSHLSTILGHVVNTRLMEVSIPQAYIARTLAALTPFHRGRKAFKLKEMEQLTGMLVYIACTVPWLRFLLSQMFSSVAAAVGDNKSYLLKTSKAFRQMLKEAGRVETSRTSTFAASEAATRVHSSPRPHFINKTLREEICLLVSTMKSRDVRFSTPIGHLVRREPSSRAWSDSCLYAAGGYSVDMGFWWYIKWPDEVRMRTLTFVRSNEHGQLVSINVLEYAGMLINYAAASHFYQHFPDTSDPFPKVLFFADNTAAESWMLKGCNSSWIGRALGRLQCAMMIGNAVGIDTTRVSTHDNVRADKISRIKRETNSMSHFLHIVQEYPELRGCRRFQPSAELISHVMDAILLKKLVDPVTVSRTVQKNPGRVIS
jgi:hypothetical protein